MCSSRMKKIWPILPFLSIFAILVHGYSTECGSGCPPENCVDHGVGIDQRYQCYDNEYRLTTAVPDRISTTFSVDNNDVNVAPAFDYNVNTNVTITILSIVIGLLVCVVVLLVAVIMRDRREMQKLRNLLEKLYDKIVTQEEKPCTDGRTAGTLEVKIAPEGRTLTEFKEPGQMLASMQTALPPISSHQGIHYSHPSDAKSFEQSSL